MEAQHGNLVVLDLDGTLIDSAPGIVEGLRLALKSDDEAAVSEETMRSWIGPPVADTLQRELGHRGEAVVTRGNRAFRDYFNEEGCWRTSLYVGVAEALEEMAGLDAALMVVTHKPEPLAERALVTSRLGSADRGSVRTRKGCRTDPEGVTHAAGPCLHEAPPGSRGGRPWRGCTGCGCPRGSDCRGALGLRVRGGVACRGGCGTRKSSE